MLAAACLFIMPRSLSHWPCACSDFSTTLLYRSCQLRGSATGDRLITFVPGHQGYGPAWSLVSGCRYCEGPANLECPAVGPRTPGLILLLSILAAWCVHQHVWQQLAGQLDMLHVLHTSAFTSHPCTMLISCYKHASYITGYCKFTASYQVESNAFLFSSYINPDLRHLQHGCIIN